jgi:flagellar protein FliO/FliZ
MRFSTFTRGAGVAGALTLSYASAAQAAPGATGEQTPLHLSTKAVSHAATAGSGGSGILRTVVALIVVIGLIYVIARILKAVKRRDVVRATGNGLEQVATLPLGTNRSLTLVRAGNELVLLGVGDHGVTAIKTYTEAEASTAGIQLPSDLPDVFDPAEKPMDRVMDRIRNLTVRS